MLSQKSLEIEGNKLYYWTNSKYDKQTIFFLHGAGVDHEMFGEQFCFFQSKYNIIAWDARWHGKSNSNFTEFNAHVLLDDINSILKTENVSKAIFIGQSIGGNIIMDPVNWTACYSGN